jgi:DNA-binding NarL/FixJ family response regulator
MAREQPVALTVRGGGMAPLLADGERVEVAPARFYWPGDVIVFQASDLRLQVVMDLSMPGRGGLETTHELKRLLPAVRILMLTTHPEDHFAVRALREGTDGYMTKDTRPEVLVSAIRQLHGGRKYISSTLAEHLALSLRDRTGGPPHQRLSTRELEILLMIGAGKTVGQIARELNLSVKTVSTYRTRILEKMNLRNNAEIMRYVLEQDLAR